MSRHRLWIFYGLLIMLVGGHLIDGVRGREHWPFSHYPMFSGVAKGELQNLQLVFVTDEPTPRQVPAQSHWVPNLQLYKFQLTAQNLLFSKTKADPEQVRQRLRDYLKAYQSLQKSGSNDGPPVTALRLYWVTLPLTLPFQPVDLTREVPKDAELMMEVHSDEKGANP